ncbi:NINE protein [Sulfobacillus sp. hq2]|uniref:NINE protein n=1 Tax=Sulfobacillus TaxID=28033 RepID=UPI000CD1199E|nr:NINE protein [Sulfobacillus sp. hq2]POB12337.1 hypothetical protein CO251_00050 [Sulfobacillus sp. hq2]
MRDKVNAGLLALFLGAFGLQKFYLRKHAQGVLYVLFSWTFIPMIASFIEAIRIFSMTDDQFDDRYNTVFHDQLENLRALRNNGRITQDQFDAQRHALTQLQ